jgi:hypothetical protein
VDTLITAHRPRRKRPQQLSLAHIRPPMFITQRRLK